MLRWITPSKVPFDDSEHWEIEESEEEHEEHGEEHHEKHPNNHDNEAYHILSNKPKNDKNINLDIPTNSKRVRFSIDIN